MRISHLQALADIVLRDPEALALAYHETVTGAEPVFDCDAARGRFAVALKAVGMATDAVCFQATCAKLHQNQESQQDLTKPACRDCGSTDLRRDAYAEWDAETRQWVLSAVYESTICLACDAESDDLCRWKPLEDSSSEPLSPAPQ